MKCTNLDWQVSATMAEMLCSSERWPLYVHYDHRGVAYTPRDHFRLEPQIERPSDCVWIVPGSTP